MYGEFFWCFAFLAEASDSCSMCRRKSMMGCCVMGSRCRTSRTCKCWRQT